MSCRAAIAGIHIESGTFSPLRSTTEDFLATRGEALLERYPFLEEDEFADLRAVPLAHFRALPGGVIRREAYDEMKREILDRLAAEDVPDAFYFDVHGAMTVEGLDDAEADLLAAIRAGLPGATLVTCSQDLHGNVSDGLVAMTDLITTYRTAPHVDWMETRRRALSLLMRAWRTGVRPVRARVGIPVLVSGEMSSTRCEPGASLYAPLAAESELPGVWDASLWVGYAWADQARSMASAVVTGTDPQAVAALAERIAARYWAARGEFRFVTETGTAEACLDQALTAGGKAAFLSDAGDNPTAGAAGDVPDTLGRLLAHPAFQAGGTSTAIFASIADAPAIGEIRRHSTGDAIAVELGGKLDPVHGMPLPVEGVIERFVDGPNPQAVLRCGGVRVIVTGKRRPYHLRGDFLALGLDPLEHEVTVVKIGYLEPELAAMARLHLMVLSPGGVPPVLENIPYRNLQRPMFPLDRNFTWTPQARIFGEAAPDI
ncbi:M81 family metallopeptidase [Luteolibacter marinus]|uniref:M81 family metallopeptidase n=1 Tax=Luteolibacter marinus TaxID=2776705 RepID=UPI001868E4FC|nr:M81 family metallopeptidase [Luteolibacter marinus]